jgi:hypothetical protein
MSKPVCIFQSPIWTRSGYGDWALAVAKSLLRYNKFELMLAPTQWGHCSKKNLDEEINDPEGKELLNRVIRGQLNKQPEVFIQMSIPNEFQAPAKFNIGMTAGIETTVPKPEWIEGLNRMNLNAVTSVHARDVFIKAEYTKKMENGATVQVKLEKPTEVTFWGADTTVFKKTDEKIESIEKVFNKIKEDFAFLFVGQWTSGNMASDRKAIGFMVKTFLETFQDTPNPPALVLKTSGAQICVMDRYECIAKIREITQMVKSQNPESTYPSVYLIHGELNEVEMNALFNQEKVKVHVSFTHGEGYGHPLLLSTLSGKPLLAPKWSGHLDFLNPNLTQYFEGNLEPIPPEAVNEWFAAEAQWFNVDYAAAGRKMKSFFSHYKGKILEDAEKLRVENSVKFSNESMDKVLHAMLDKYVPDFAVEQTIVLPKLKKLNLPKLNKLPTSA